MQHLTHTASVPDNLAQSLSLSLCSAGGRRARGNTGGSREGLGVRPGPPLSAGTAPFVPAAAANILMHAPFQVVARNMPYSTTHDFVSDLFFNASCSVRWISATITSA
jgi:hypothetical protein